jgi:PLP dependent protein
LGAAGRRSGPTCAGAVMTAVLNAATSDADAAAKLQSLRREIAQASQAARRDPATVTLIAVSKTFGSEAIVPVLEAGQRVFGENRVQEAKAKWPAFKEQYPDLSLHLIGPLQSNKAREAVALFDAIHAVDRDSLCEALAREIARQGRQPLLLAEINTGGEPQKSGVLPQAADDFLRRCRDTHGLAIAGLMCLPPLDEPPAPHFALTAKIARRHGLKLLSMGMSADFAQAIAFGATHVRIGTAIFGERG